MNPENGGAAGRPEQAHDDTGRQALEWAVVRGFAAEVAARARVRVRRRQQRRGTLAAGCLVLGAVMFVIWPRSPMSGVDPSMLPAVPAAVVSVPPAHALPDGSRIELKEGARFTVQFSPQLRRIKLDAGEAHFAVIRDPARPFVVAVDGVEVRAVGTEFSVARGESQVDVVVTKGRVVIDQAAVESRTDAPRTRSAPVKTLATVDAGERVVVEVNAAAPPPVVAMSSDEQKQRLAWRVPRIEFSGTLLRDAIPLFNRYGGVQLSVHAHVGHVRLSGVLRASDTDSLLMLLENEFGIVARPRADGMLELTR